MDITNIAPPIASGPLETIELPTGERHDVLASDGERLVIEVWTPPMDEPNVLHVHERSDEVFEVLVGRLRFTLDGEVSELGPGDSILIPRGAAHRWQVIGDEELHARVEFNPGCEFDAFLRDYAVLVTAGRTKPSGMPGFRDFALMQRRHWRDMRVTMAPAPVLRVVVAAGVALASITGHRLPEEGVIS